MYIYSSSFFSLVARLTITASTNNSARAYRSALTDVSLVGMVIASSSWRIPLRIRFCFQPLPHPRIIPAAHRPDSAIDTLGIRSHVFIYYYNRYVCAVIIITPKNYILVTPRYTSLPPTGDSKIVITKHNIIFYI